MAVEVDERFGQVLVDREAAAAVAEAEALTGSRIRPGHTTVGPLSVFNGDLDEAADLIIESVRRGRGARVATANLDFVARARRDAVLQRDLATSSIVTADGAPVAWLARLAGGARTRRVTGVDLVAALCARAARLGELRVAFYGSEPETARIAADTLEARFPGVRVVTTICPPFRTQAPDEIDRDIARLVALQPHVVLVALGCPRQERFIADHFDAIPGAAWIGVGGTFDFYAGKRRRAPGMLQAVGAEWVARLAQEPRRLWRRYFVEDLPALAFVAPSCLLRPRQQASAASDLDGLRRELIGR